MKFFKSKKFKITAIVFALLIIVGLISTYCYIRTTYPIENLPSWITEKPIAHRGLHDASAGIPENSTPAFKHAIDKGYPIELDVHILKDDTLIVFHDFDLKRMAGLNKDVADCTWNETKDLTFTGSKEKIPTFEQTLKLIAGKVPLLIELKNDSRKDRRLERAVAKALENYTGQFAVQSFNPFSLRWFRKHHPNIPRGQLSGDFRDKPDLAWHKKIFLGNLLLNGISQPAFIAYDHHCMPHWILSTKRGCGATVIAWTTRDAQQEAHARDFADNIIFENYTPVTE